MNKPMPKDWASLLEALAGESPATKYLNSLPTYKCPMCGKSTIFINGCGDCMNEAEGA